MEKLQVDQNYAKLIIKDGWVICPVCLKGKILKVRPDTCVENLPRPCKRCGQETLVNIDMRLSQSRTATSA